MPKKTESDAVPEFVGQPVEEPAAPPAEPERRTPLAWAEAKGMAAPLIDVGGFVKSNPEHVKFAAARGLKAWGDETMVTEVEFDTAVEQAWTMPLGRT